MQVVHSIWCLEVQQDYCSARATLARSAALLASALLLAVRSPFAAWTGISGGRNSPATVLVSCRRRR